MAAPMDAPLPPDIDMWDGCVIRVTALDAATGNVVSGVNISDVTLQVVQLAGEATALQVGAWRLVPGPGA